MTEPGLDAFRYRRPDRHRVTVAVRYADLDTNRHVNHASYLAYLEEARIALRASMADLIGGGDLSFPIAEVTVRYLESVPYPGQVEVEIAPLRVGRTSLILGYGIFEGDRCMALAQTRSVCFSRAAGGPVALPEAYAAGLRGLIAAVPAD